MKKVFFFGLVFFGLLVQGCVGSVKVKDIKIIPESAYSDKVPPPPP